MKGKVLVTDTLFISDEHVKQIEDAGYEVQRLPKANASEGELIEALQGKIGYILGGIEKVTDKVIESATDLKAIAFTGADWQAIIPGWQSAKLRGIKITNAPGANSPAVAEFSLAMALMMQRNLFDIGRTGDVKFQTTRTLHNSVIGVIGAGKIGSRIIKSAQSFSPSRVIYFSRTQKQEIDDTGALFVKKDELLAESDVIFIAAPGSAGQVLDRESISKIKDDALIIHISPLNMVDVDALLERLQEGTLRAAIDWPAPSEEFINLPNRVWYNTNNHSAYNTESVIQLCSDMGTSSLLNMLDKGNDEYEVF